jgi:prolyl oligopeptidase
MAYLVNKKGSDWQTAKIRDATTFKDLPEELDWLKFSSIDWTDDNKGFFYGRYDAPKVSHGKQGEAGEETEALQF